MKRFLAFLGLLVAVSASAQRTITPIGSGVGGGLSNAYSFSSAAFTVVNATNVFWRVGALGTNIYLRSFTTYGQGNLEAQMALTNGGSLTLQDGSAITNEANSVLQINEGAIFNVASNVDWVLYDGGRMYLHGANDDARSAYIRMDSGAAITDNTLAHRWRFVSGASNGVVRWYEITNFAGGIVGPLVISNTASASNFVAQGLGAGQAKLFGTNGNFISWDAHKDVASNMNLTLPTNGAGGTFSGFLWFTNKSGATNFQAIWIPDTQVVGQALTWGPTGPVWTFGASVTNYMFNANQFVASGNTNVSLVDGVRTTNSALYGNSVALSGRFNIGSVYFVTNASDGITIYDGANSKILAVFTNNVTSLGGEGSIIFSHGGTVIGGSSTNGLELGSIVVSNRSILKTATLLYSGTNLPVPLNTASRFVVRHMTNNAVVQLTNELPVALYGQSFEVVLVGSTNTATNYIVNWTFPEGYVATWFSPTNTSVSSNRAVRVQGGFIDTNLLWLSAVESTNTVAAPPPQAGTTLTNGLVFYYALDEFGGTRYDSKPGGTNHVDDVSSGTDFVNRSTNTASVNGYAAAFHGGDSGVLQSASHGPDMNAAMYFAYWIRLNGTNALMGAFNKRASSGITEAYQSYYDPAFGTFQFGLGNGVDYFTNVYATAFGAPATNTWYCVQCWKDTNAGNAKVYIRVNNSASNSVAWTANYTNSAPLRIGTATQTPQFSLNGDIRNFAAWSRILTTAEQAEYYGSGTPTNLYTKTFSAPQDVPLTNGIMAYYAMENVNDSSTNANNLTDHGTVTFVVGKVSNCSTNNGTSQWLSKADNATFDHTTTLGGATSGLTFDFWAKMQDKSTYRAGPSKRTTSGAGTIEVQTLYNVDYDRFVVAVGNGTTYTEAKSAFKPSTTVWYHISGGYDPTNQCVYLYVNNDGPTRVRYTLSAVQDGAAALDIGALWNDGTLPWSGTLDEVMFRNKVLTDAQRSSRYNGGNGDTWPFTY